MKNNDLKNIAIPLVGQFVKISDTLNARASRDVAGMERITRGALGGDRCGDMRGMAWRGRFPSR